MKELFLNKEFIYNIIIIISLFIAILMRKIYLRYKKYNCFFFCKKLSKHWLLNELKAWIEEARYMQFINAYKTALGRDLWRIKLEAGYKHLKRFAEAFDKGYIKDVSLILNVIEDIVKDYHINWNKENIPIVLIDDFDKFHNANIKQLVEQINIILKQKYMNDYEKLMEIYHLFRAVYIFSKAHIYYIVNKANGSLKDKIYKGIKNTNEFI